MTDKGYLELLNPQQRDAVEYSDGPALVIAGAGSGKTRVLTYKIVHLLNSGYKPWEIMALTFTNKAAREMKERIAAVVGEQTASQLVMGTFHSVFLRILRHHAAKLGYKSSFTIYDAADSKSLVKMIIKDLGLDDKKYRPNTIASIISNAKNELVSPAQYLADKDRYHEDSRAQRPMTGEIYRLYVERCKRADAMDFDDILFNMNVLLRDNPEIAFEYGRRFKYILVDEYQDTNFAQHLIIKTLVKGHNRLCVVGDDAQSIYSFRGANINNILNLQRSFEGLKIFKLERNYRSTQNIVNAAGSLIKKNRFQHQKNVYSEKEEGSKVEIIRNYSDIEEGNTVASLINDLQHKFHDSLEEYALLYRTNAQSRQLEEALRKRNIPYRVYGGLAFFQRKEVKDAISYFRLAVNPDDDEALRRVINFPARGIGETTMAKVQKCAVQNGKSMWEIVRAPEANALNVNAATAKKLITFAEMIERFQKDAQTLDAYEVGTRIIQNTGILSLLVHENTPEAISRQENIEEVINSLKFFLDNAVENDTPATLEEYLAGVSLRTDQDEKDSDDRPKVTLMTIHASKGLEFRHIIITGLEENLFPSEMCMDSEQAMEEERRLMYVAVTRAEETCHITYAGTRYRNGKTTSMVPSRFLHDFDPKYIHTQGALNSYYGGGNSYGGGYSYGGYGSSYRRKNDTPSHTEKRKEPASAVDQYIARINNSPNSTARIVPMGEAPKQSVAPTECNASIHTKEELKVGSKIIHPKFGHGSVTHVGVETDAMITVDFELTGTKRLMLRFAKFEIVD